MDRASFTTSTTRRFLKFTNGTSQCSASWEPDTVAEMAYVASHASNLSFPVDINQVPENMLGPNDSPSALPYPVYQGITGDTFNGISNYNSLQTSISRRFASGTSLSINYTWSHFLDDQDSRDTEVQPERRPSRDRTIHRQATALPISTYAAPSREESSMSCHLAKGKCS